MIREDVIKEVRNRLSQETVEKVYLFKNQLDEILNTMDDVVDVIYDVLAEKVLKCETDMLSVYHVEDILKGLFDIDVQVCNIQFQLAIYYRVKDHDFDFYYPQDEEDENEVDDHYMIFYREREVQRSLLG